MNEQHEIWEEQVTFVAHGLCHGVLRFRKSNEDGSTTPMIDLRLRLRGKRLKGLGACVSVRIPATHLDNVETEPATSDKLTLQFRHLLNECGGSLASLVLTPVRFQYIISLDENGNLVPKVVEIVSEREWARTMNATRVEFVKGEVSDGMDPILHWDEQVAF